MKRKNLQILMGVIFMFTASMAFARDFIIFSIVQDLPMGYEQEVVNKNFYVNIGSEQGVNEGTTLDVVRTISRLDPYKRKERYTYNIKIGELEVLHSEKGSAIATLKESNVGKDQKVYDIGSFMVGDRVNVKVK
ncbi:hypothetical protein [Halobacteriovorax sp. HLS]|uniref:hypothetical protein n=1 Tax=Halobacteriovorax sp. HLS TaxID=2234000 RepID=UPI000FD6EDA9|nr:hypothetical protein [Halobacteriovorax sp. HLS]